ncbi:hypothetical protein A3B60_00720 [Candidatus Peregrinibacteria bacterium RIFCSPLOWO2_01_FULL_39_12]|nr:MAG: hypothetical protein A3B60_00720 [Candidatus Peregrinibacteria bacterium RIFCSPLOWO2_01_FULL_39_12]OGJ43796.1 MAG: hypothetical protein A3I58_01135 [Candidatus Peregrinibacteria bacterium RIFCSPLOWO2_02_FULL_39_10]
MKIKYFLIPAVLALTLFSGCSSEEDKENPTNEATENPNKISYEETDFSLSIPSSWEVINKDSFTSNVPANTIVGFRNNIKNEGFTANLNITQTNLTEEISSEDFAKSSMAKTKNSLVNFAEINKDTTSVNSPDGEIEAYLAEMEGKKSANEPVVHFKQLHVVNKDKAYTITAAYLKEEDESVINMLDEMIGSFTLK